MALLLKTVDATRGPRWIGDALRLFLRKPMGFAWLFMSFLLATLLLSLVPVVGGMLQMMTLPLLSLGFMVASQSALLDGPIKPTQFIEPLQGDANKRRSLLILCLIYGVLAIAILWLCNVVSDSAMVRLQTLMAKGDSKPADINALLSEPGVATAALLGLGLGSLLSVPFWHAPALVHWGAQGVSQALFSSTLAVWRCRGALFTYVMAWTGLLLGLGLGVTLVLSLLGLGHLVGVVSLPLGLLLSTVFYVSLLFTFNDSFGGASPALVESPPAG